MTKQYYYKDNACKAVLPADDGCICWHDEGTGPYPLAAPGHTLPVTGIELSWRDKAEERCPSCDGLRYDAWGGNPERDCTVCNGQGTKPDDRMTLDELRDLFGGEIPKEAVALLFNAPDDKTIGEVRAEVEAMAKRQQAAGSFTADINNCDNGWVQVTISGPGADMLTEEQIEDALRYAGPMEVDLDMNRLRGVLLGSRASGGDAEVSINLGALRSLYGRLASLANAAEHSRNAAGTIVKLIHKSDVMRDALRPFADFASASMFSRLPDNHPITQGSGIAHRQVTAGDFKRAATVLMEEFKE